MTLTRKKAQGRPRYTYDNRGANNKALFVFCSHIVGHNDSMGFPKRFFQTLI